MIDKYLKRLFVPSKKVAYLVYKISKIDYTKSITKIIKIIKLNRLQYKYNIILGTNAYIGKNVRFPHPQNIVIGDYVKIKDNCVIYQDVTIGLKNYDVIDKEEAYPVIEDDVIIYSGAKILGAIKIGQGAIIAANSVVINDVEPNYIYGGIPAKKIKSLSEVKNKNEEL